MPRKSRLADIRFDDIFPYRKDGLCRCGCGAKAKRCWASRKCSNRCLDEYNFRKGYSEAIRKAVFARDKGVCALCLLDTEEARHGLQRARHAAYALPLRSLEYTAARLACEAEERKWLERGFHGISTAGDWWQGHHVKAVVDGGNHSLDNLITVCTPCHKAATASLANRRASDRKTGEPVLIILPSPLPLPPPRSRPAPVIVRVEFSDDLSRPTENRLTFV